MPRIQRLILSVMTISLVVILSGCDVDAIWVSRDGLDFQRDSNPQYFDVANENGNLGTINVSILPDKTWLKVAPALVPCDPPQPSGLVKSKVEVRIDRTKIPDEGTHEGTILLKAPGVKPVRIKVSAIKDDMTPVLKPLNIINPVTSYSRPYLVEFAFSLRDQDDRAVTGEPAQFQIAGYEDDYPVGIPQGLSLRRGAARQLWLEVILDYSIIMREIENAIPEMERAVTEVLLPSLNEDVLVSASGFYRDNLDSTVIVPYTANHAHVADRVLASQTELFGGWASGARVYDALMSAIQRFKEMNLGEQDEKYIVLFCNGRDTSSITLPTTVIDKAKEAGVHIIVIGFGESIEAGDLITLALSANGRFISASALEDLQESFERIVEDLNCQYVVRWASLRRDFIISRPSFSITLGDASASYRANKNFIAQNYAGDPLRGDLVLIQSDTPDNTTVFLRASYVPYDISEMHFRVGSDYNYQVSVVNAANDGLIADWQLTVAEEEGGTQLISVQGNTPMPFASFGAMLRFKFSSMVDTPFTVFEVDNSVYFDGQTFVIR